MIFLKWYCDIVILWYSVITLKQYKNFSQQRYVISSCDIVILWYSIQWSTEGRRSTAVAEGFSPTATAAEGLKGRRPKLRPKAKNFSKIRPKILKSWAKILANSFENCFSKAVFLLSFGFLLLHESWITGVDWRCQIYRDGPKVPFGLRCQIWNLMIFTSRTTHIFITIFAYVRKDCIFNSHESCIFLLWTCQVLNSWFVIVYSLQMIL